jgi:hypothetical protein
MTYNNEIISSKCRGKNTVGLEQSPRVKQGIKTNTYYCDSTGERWPSERRKFNAGKTGA